MTASHFKLFGSYQDWKTKQNIVLEVLGHVICNLKSSIYILFQEISLSEIIFIFEYLLPKI